MCLLIDSTIVWGVFPLLGATKNVLADEWVRVGLHLS